MHQYLVILTMILTSAIVKAQELAPEFSFNEENGTSAMLSDLRGEVLYVSFWASWCKPCIANFAKYSDTRERLERMGVILLNVNIDQSEEKWRQSIKAYSISGQHVRGKDLDELQSVYQLYSIPSYEIINKKGEFVYLSNTGSRDIFEEFKSWLKE